MIGLPYAGTIELAWSHVIMRNTNMSLRSKRLGLIIVGRETPMGDPLRGLHPAFRNETGATENVQNTALLFVKVVIGLYAT
jgi:hypothetical protein